MTKRRRQLKPKPPPERLWILFDKMGNLWNVYSERKTIEANLLRDDYLVEYVRAGGAEGG